MTMWPDHIKQEARELRAQSRPYRAISQTLSRRHSVSVSKNTVVTWCRGVVIRMYAGRKVLTVSQCERIQRDTVRGCRTYGVQAQARDYGVSHCTIMRILKECGK